MIIKEQYEHESENSGMFDVARCTRLNRCEEGDVTLPPAKW
jgi:hypothetical protein